MGCVCVAALWGLADPWCAGFKEGTRTRLPWTAAVWPWVRGGWTVGGG